MKKTIFKGLLILGFIASIGTIVTLSSVSADSVYDQASIGYGSQEALANDSFTIEQMLTYAIQDEFMAQAEYQAIINEFGDIRPFTNVVSAEGTHISLLLPLFEAYGIEVPANDAANNVVVPESITSAFATGVQAEKMNIEMYQKFLSQTDLPDDIRNVFTYLMNASIQHQNAFSKDRYSGLATDAMKQIRNKFQFKGSNEGQSKTQNQFRIKSMNECPNQ